MNLTFSSSLYVSMVCLKTYAARINESMIFTFFLQLFLIIDIYLQQSDEHSKQDTKKLQIGTSFSHLAKRKKIIPVMLQWHFWHFIDILWFYFHSLNLTKISEQ